jgi:hypothetical protein
MPDPHPPHLDDALASFRAAADAAVERGRRVAGDAQAANTAFERESERIARAQPHDPAHLGDDLRKAAVDYRVSRGLPIPGETPADEPKPKRRRPPEDEDFSEYHVLRPL